MFWIILLIIAVVGFLFWLFLFLGTKNEENSVGGKIATMNDKFRYIGNILRQEKSDVNVNGIIEWERCIKQDEFLFSYDEYGRMDNIVLHSDGNYYEIFNIDFYKDGYPYSYKSGSWDSFLLNAIEKLNKKALDKDRDELLSEECKQIYVENYFNELFAKKINTYIEVD